MTLIMWYDCDVSMRKMRRFSGPDGSLYHGRLLDDVDRYGEKMQLRGYVEVEREDTSLGGTREVVVYYEPEVEALRKLRRDALSEISTIKHRIRLLDTCLKEIGAKP